MPNSFAFDRQPTAGLHRNNYFRSRRRLPSSK